MTKSKYVLEIFTLTYCNEQTQPNCQATASTSNRFPSVIQTRVDAVGNAHDGENVSLAYDFLCTTQGHRRVVRTAQQTHRYLYRSASRQDREPYSGGGPEVAPVQLWVGTGFQEKNVRVPQDVAGAQSCVFTGNRQ